MTEIVKVKEQMQTSLSDFQKQASLQSGQIFVVGCSTSEVLGERIGTSGTMEVAEVIFSELKQFQAQTGIELAFQCCEHLNRALVVEREVAMKYQLEIVTVMPVRSAGGALATYAYHYLKDPVVVEFIKADAGMDIGDTFIGMHLKHVAVPIRTSVKEIGSAHVTMAKTRAKLIGGARAVYAAVEETVTCS
ncbi:TIGR01440 family protein [Bacillus sp. TL12]|uniref:TIGR01440 family protein n=1 Tax=Bacillus sp. TL12 TaxID=2894756 RepID=UPI001F5261C0|nr:TIGR01440 family protein [Bacillus sp. TL12]MCI0766614.1 TIGR01440 family protein [Bacillus sp. TL12]